MKIWASPHNVDFKLAYPSASSLSAVLSLTSARNVIDHFAVVHNFGADDVLSRQRHDNLLVCRAIRTCDLEKDAVNTCAVCLRQHPAFAGRKKDPDSHASN